MSAQLDDKRRLKLAAQGLRKTAISLQAAVVSLLQTADALSAETDDNLVENNPLDINLQDFLKGDINNALIKLLNDALNNEGEVLDDDRRPQQNGKRAANGVKKPTRKPRPPRDPNAPTKPQNAFILFQKDIASQVKAENAGKPWSEIVHLISTRWKALPKEEREVYEHKFEAAKQTYEAELKIYMKNKDQETAAVDPDGHEEHNGSSESSTAESQSTASQSDEEDEDDTPNPSISRVSRSKVAKSSASAKNTPHPNPESSSKKKSKKRKPQDDDDNESAHEEEDHYELSKKSKKKASNEESGEVRGKDHKKSKKIPREEDIDMDDKFKKKKNKKN